MREELVGPTSHEEEAPCARSALFARLAGAIREGRVELGPCRRHWRLGVDPEALLLVLSAWRARIYDELEARDAHVPVRQLRVLADWFAQVAERALREQSRRYVALLDALPDQVTLSSADGDVVFQNRAARAAPAAEVEPDPELFARALAGATATAEARRPRRDPRARWRELQASPVRSDDGSVEGVAFASRDIEERKRSEARLCKLHAQLQRSEARFRVALVDSNVSVAEMDRELRIRWIYNPRHLSRTELLGKHVGELCPPDMAEQLLAVQRRVLETGRPARTASDVTVDGRRYHFLFHYRPLRDERGAVVGLAGAAVDITHAKQAQEELAQALAFREQMIGVLGHDLRNPLAAIRSLAGLLLLRGGLPARAEDSLEQIDRASRRMGEMIATLLDFSDARFRGRLPITPGPTELGALTREALDELRLAHPGRELRLREEAALAGAWDRARLQQVVSNLVGNALQHGDPEQPVLVSLRADGPHAVLEVENHGPAIPPEEAKRLFEPFRRGSDGHGDAPRSRGLGLGLYIVQQIVHAHGGTITVRSTAEATRFTVRLERDRALLLERSAS